jgi:hypothetical protein
MKKQLLQKQSIEEVEQPKIVLKQFENESEVTKEEVENDTMGSKVFILNQTERLPEDMSALSAESLFLPENQSQSNNLHSQEAEIINMKKIQLQKKT